MEARAEAEGGEWAMILVRRILWRISFGCYTDIRLAVLLLR